VSHLVQGNSREKNGKGRGGEAPTWLGQGRLRSADVGTSIRPSLICIGDDQDSNLLSPDLLPRGPRHLHVLWNHVQRFEHGARLYASQGTEDNAAGRWPHRFRRLGPGGQGTPWASSTSRIPVCGPSSSKPSRGRT